MTVHGQYQRGGSPDGGGGATCCRALGAYRKEAAMSSSLSTVHSSNASENAARPAGRRRSLCRRSSALVHCVRRAPPCGTDLAQDRHHRIVCPDLAHAVGTHATGECTIHHPSCRGRMHYTAASSS